MIFVIMNTKYVSLTLVNLLFNDKKYTYFFFFFHSLLKKNEKSENTVTDEMKHTL